MEKLRNEIIKEYKNYCNDLNLKIGRYSKEKFLNDYVAHYEIFYNVSFTDKEIKDIKTILKDI